MTLAVRRSENSALYCSLFRLSEVLPLAVQGLLSSLILSIFQTERVIFLVAGFLKLVAVIYTSTCVLDLDAIEEYEEEV